MYYIILLLWRFRRHKCKLLWEKKSSQYLQNKLARCFASSCYTSLSIGHKEHMWPMMWLLLRKHMAWCYKAHQHSRCKRNKHGTLGCNNMHICKSTSTSSCNYHKYPEAKFSSQNTHVSKGRRKNIHFALILRYFFKKLVIVFSYLLYLTFYFYPGKFYVRKMNGV